jgi:hypothetical protein
MKIEIKQDSVKTKEFHHQGSNVYLVGSRAASACYLLHAGFLPGLFFDPED